MYAKRITAFAARIILRAIFLVALAHAPGISQKVVPQEEPLPKALLGTWRITGVLVDTGTPRWLHIHYNHPAYMGSLLFISPKRILTHIEIGYSCKNPRMVVQHTTAGALIRDTMGERLDPPIHPTTKDYGLPFQQNEKVKVMWIKDFGGYADYLTIHGTWMLPLPDGRLAMCWNDGSIVVFSRAPANTKPVASFDCAKARMAEEKAICGSMELALMDRDVSSWYTGILESLENRARLGGGQKQLDAIKALKKAQRTWLAKRNTCGADPSCLIKSMEEQSDFLSKFEIP